VTVCIAAICDGNTIFGAADRMVTTEDVEFEPPMPKIIPLTTSIRIMTAGDSALQSEILQDVSYEVFARIDKDPDNWWKIKDVAELYVKFYNSAKLSRAETAILAPIGLNRETFIVHQQQMSKELVTSLAKEMLHFELSYVSTIVTGIDMTGAHIYMVRQGEISCLDTVGFASIGSGSRHAESQFMLARHTPSSPFADTFLLVYSAKKRAEVAPGVGEDTDVFMIGGLGYATQIKEEIVKGLEKIYQEIANKERKIQKDARREVRSYLDTITEAAAKQKQKPEDTPQANGEQAPTDGQAL